MLKQIVISATMIISGAVAASAQPAASLQKVSVPGADFDIVIATAKSLDGPIYRFDSSPDTLIIPLAEGRLALGFEDAATMLKAFNSLRNPACALDPAKTRIHAGIYIVRKGDAAASSMKK